MHIKWGSGGEELGESMMGRVFSGCTGRGKEELALCFVDVLFVNTCDIIQKFLTLSLIVDTIL